MLVQRVTFEKPTNKHISDTKQEVCREEGDSIEGERLQAARASREVKDPDHHTAQAEVHRPTVHNDPVVALWDSKQKDKPLLEKITR